VLIIVGELLLLAIGAGFIGSISGLGGGVFIVPGLTLLGHISIHVAIGASLISVVATSAGASAAFVRDGWTNLRVAMALEVATVSGALIGASLAGHLSARLLELLFAAMMLASAYFAASKHGQEHVLLTSDPMAERLKLGSSFPERSGKIVQYGVRNLPGGAAIMVVAGLMSGMLGIGAGALKVVAMDSVMGLPLKVSSATSNFMIGVTAGAGALVFLSRGDISVVISAPVALGVTAGALVGSRVLMHANVQALRVVFIVLLLLIALEMGWRAVSGI